MTEASCHDVTVLYELLSLSGNGCHCWLPPRCVCVCSPLFVGGGNELLQNSLPLLCPFPNVLLLVLVVSRADYSLRLVSMVLPLLLCGLWS